MFSITAECSRCGKSFLDNTVLTVCSRCGGALLLRYDLARIAEKVSRSVLEKREDTFWKFIELLPLSSHESIVSLGEPYSPILRLSKGCGTAFDNVCVKDDGRLPTGTFKARGMAVAVSKLNEFGIKHVVIPSTGNAAAALAAYGAKAGIEVYAFMPKDVPESILKECVFMGARVYLVEGLINDAAETVKKFKRKYGWVDMSTNKQPYRFEGYKAMAFEIAEQYNWKPPDSIIFPTGGGEGIIGLWKGFKELIELNWTEKIPRLIIVQSSGCAPLVKAHNKSETEVKEPWENAETIAAGLRVPHPYASYLILRAIKETNGMAVAVDDKEIVSSMKNFFKMGIYACPEAASTLAALNKLENEGVFDPKEKMLLCLTGNAMKYFDVMGIERDGIPVLNKDANSLA
ncbi:MAG: threonine synthase [Candidatus Bathyarchaeota archaeon]|nr:threonine synthase [Candidatus Bathyarchaeota archaeon]